MEPLAAIHLPHFCLSIEQEQAATRRPEQSAAAGDGPLMHDDRAHLAALLTRASDQDVRVDRRRGSEAVAKVSARCVEGRRTRRGWLTRSECAAVVLSTARSARL